MAEVFEFLTDGKSTFAPGGVEGMAMMCGYCSKAHIINGKGIIVGDRYPITETFGIGPLVDAIDDAFSVAGQNTTFIAVPVFTANEGRIEVNAVEDDKEQKCTFSGKPQINALIKVDIIRSGGLGEAVFRYSMDKGVSYSKSYTVPTEGSFPLNTIFNTNIVPLGITLTFSGTDYTIGENFSARTFAPVPSLVEVFEAMAGALDTYDIEFVHIVSPSNAIDWAAASALAEELWSLHRPTYFKMETRLPNKDESLSDFTAYLVAERKKIATNFVQVCAQYGYIQKSTGLMGLRNFCALHTGKTLSNPVQRAAGRVKDGALSNTFIPENWDSVQKTIEETGYITAKRYAGLTGVYFGDSPVLCDEISDYKFEEIIRVVFKGLRKLRIAALKSLYDEAADPLIPYTDGGLAYLKAQLSNALDSMKKAIPQELIDYVINIPKGQDIVNNGIAVEVTFVGVPIIRTIKIYGAYIHAGSKFDPRLKPL